MDRLVSGDPSLSSSCGEGVSRSAVRSSCSSIWCIARPETTALGKLHCPEIFYSALDERRHLATLFQTPGFHGNALRCQSTTVLFRNIAGQHYRFTEPGDGRHCIIPLKRGALEWFHLPRTAVANIRIHSAHFRPSQIIKYRYSTHALARTQHCTSLSGLPMFNSIFSCRSLHCAAQKHYHPPLTLYRIILYSPTLNLTR